MRDQTMAKKTVTQAPSRGPKRVIASFKGTDEFDDWLERFANHLRLPKSTLIEHAIVDFARSKKFEDPPVR
jgi:predicted transcriptional regulator